jgi:hypothetical protein
MWRGNLYPNCTPSRGESKLRIECSASTSEAPLRATRVAPVTITYIEGRQVP